MTEDDGGGGLRCTLKQWQEFSTKVKLVVDMQARMVV